MVDILKTVRQCALFRTLPEEVITQQILPWGQLAVLPKKQQIIRPQQEAETFSVVLSGKVRIEYSLPEGESCLQAVLTAGDVLGAELIIPQEELASYHALTATAASILSFPVRMLTVPGLIGEECRREILRQLLALLSRDIMRRDFFLAMLSRKGLRERIVMYLRYLAQRNGSDTFEISLNRDEMAAILCVNRSCLSHELSLMERDGMITFRKGQFTLHEPRNWKCSAESK